MASASQSGEYVTVGMSEEQLSAAIEKSREQGWSELANGGQSAAAGSPQGQDALIWEELKRRHPKFFRDGVDVELGRLVAEGGQAHIYEAHVGSYPKDFYVAKVFKLEGFSLTGLQRHWPLVSEDANSGYDSGGVEFVNYCSHICWGAFLKDGRFALVMDRYWGDLRTLINLKLSRNNSQGPPFPDDLSVRMMRDIA